MTEPQNLSGKDAIAKIREIAGGAMAMFLTHGETPGMIARPMSTQAIDDDGTLWFFSRRGSRKNAEIAADPTVQLLYAHTATSKYLSIVGKAHVLRDQHKIDEIWHQHAKAWFSEGKTDPELTLIAFSPVAAHYWDTKHNVMVQLAGMAIGAVTGKTLDDSREGDVRVD